MTVFATIYTDNYFIKRNYFIVPIYGLLLMPNSNYLEGALIYIASG